jgi:transposase
VLLSPAADDNQRVLRRFPIGGIRSPRLKATIFVGGPKPLITPCLKIVVVDAVQARLARNPDKMRARRQSFEHPLGTIKSWMGATYFLMKTLKNVNTGAALHVRTYNMKWVMRIPGVV